MLAGKSLSSQQLRLTIQTRANTSLGLPNQAQRPGGSNELPCTLDQVLSGIRPHETPLHPNARQDDQHAYARTAREHRGSAAPGAPYSSLSPFQVTADDNLANLKVQVAPCDLTRFTFPAARERQAAHEVRAISRTPCPGVFYNLDNLKKLITARQRELLCAHWHAFQAFRGVAVDNTCILRHVEHMS